MTKRIHKYFFYTLLTIVYGVFFSVESFYNFDGHSGAKKESAPSAAFYALGNGQARTSPLPIAKPHGMRLNKRYHQANFPPCPIFRIEPPVVYVAPQILGALPIRPLPTVTLVSSQLRGPPVAA